MLLRNHGPLAVGKTVAEAFNNAYRLERACRTQLMAQNGNDEILLPATGSYRQDQPHVPPRGAPPDGRARMAGDAPAGRPHRPFLQELTMKRLLLCIALVLPFCAVAQERFPDKPVRLIVPFPPGGGTDALARILAAKLGELWGQQVIVENRAGAQGNIGTAAGAKAAPDGYTLTFAHQGALVINPHIYKDTGYDTLKDFAPVALATQMAFIAVAHPSVPANDLRELAQYAKKNPGKLSFASTSAGPHIVGELFKQATGTDLLHVPYKGAGPAITDLLGGQVNLMFSNPTSTVPHVRSGKLRALGRDGPQAQPGAARRADRAGARHRRSCRA